MASGIPVMVRDKELTRQISNAVTETGGMLSRELKLRLMDHWKVHRFVSLRPEDPTEYVMYQDLGGETPRYRIGVFLGAEADSLRVHPVSQTPLSLPRQRIGLGSAGVGTSDEFEGSPVVNFLDYAVLRIAQEVSSRDDRPNLVNIMLHAEVDALAEDLKLNRQINRMALRQLENLAENACGLDHDGAEHLKSKICRAIASLIPDTNQGPDLSSVLLERAEAVRVLRTMTNDLEDLLYEKFVQVGLPVLERENLEPVLTERMLAEDYFDQFALASDDPGRVAEYGKLYCGTHVVMVEVKQAQDGPYLLSIRLVDVNTSEVLWAGTGGAGGKEFLSPSAAYCMMDAGQVKVVQFGQGSARVDQPQKLRLASLDLNKPQNEARVGYIREQGSQVFYRDLFSYDWIPVERSQIKSITDIGSAQALTPESSLRFLTYQVARHVMPHAGQIVQTEVGPEGTAWLDLSAANGVKVGQRFALLRRDSEGVNRILPLQLVARQVDQQRTEVAVDAGLRSVWPDGGSPQLGDLVVPLGETQPLVAIGDIKYSPDFLDVRITQAIRGLTPANRDKLQVATINAEKSAAHRLRAALTSLDVPCLDQTLQQKLGKSISAQQVMQATGATRAIYGTIVPDSSSPSNPRFSIRLKVVASDGTSEVALPEVTVFANQLESWHP